MISTTNSTGNKGPVIPAGGGYTLKIENTEITVGATGKGTPQIGYRIGWYKNNVHVGSLVNYRTITDNMENLRITIEQLEAFGATSARKEFSELLGAKRKTLTGFGSKDAGGSLKYEVYNGKQQPRISIFASGVRLKGQLSGAAAAGAASKVAAMIAAMGNGSGSSTGSAPPDFDPGDPAEDFDRLNGSVADDPGDHNADFPQF